MVEGGELFNVDECSRETEKADIRWSVWWWIFGVKIEYHSFNESVKLFVKDLQQAYHIQDCLSFKYLGVDISKKGKVCCIYSYYKRHSGNWYVKEIGDTEHIRHGAV